jgi:hypothetical protein
MAKGWLDNYGKEDNYNDSSVSAPEGFQGDGYSNVGRNYSPAWGGQFQMGGNVYPVNYVPQAQDGNTISNLGQEGIDFLQSIYRNHPPSTLFGRLPFNLGSGIGLLQSHINKEPERLSDQLGVFPNPYTQVASLVALESETEKENMHEFAKNKNRGKDLKKIVPKKESNFKISDDRNFQMGGSLPGATGHMYARVGAPSNSKYAKKTLASAQDGKTVKYGTPEYEEAYNKGEVITKEGVRSPILLDEVVVKGKKKDKNWLEQYADKIVDENKDAGVLGAILGTPISAVTSLPQLMGMKAFTGEMERPSEGLDIENPYGAFAVDAIADPANLIGVGELSGLSKLAKEKALAKLVTSKESGLLSKVSRLNPFKGKKFNSEIDWSKWNKEIPENSQLMKEYNAIEETSKANGSWMKNSDGSVFKGTPEQFIQQNSKNFNKAFPNGVEEFYRGNQHFNPELNSGNHSGFDTHITFGTSNKDIAEKYATNGGFNLNDEYQNIGKQVDFYHPDINTPGTYTGSYADVDAGMYHVGVDKNLEKKIVEGNNERWFNVDDPETLEWKRNEYPDFRTEVEKGFEEKQIDKVTTDNIASYIADKQIPLAKVKNLNDDLQAVGGNSSDIIMINPKLAKPKSLRYNNGMFDMSNPNIYKSIVPGAIGLGAASQLKQKRDGGVIKDDMGQWAHPGEVTEINSNDITMEGVPYYVLGISDTGDTKLMKPGKNYKFKGKKVTEYPMAKNGVNQQDEKSLQQLDQLTNFTNYNTKQPGGWLDNL